MKNWIRNLLVLLVVQLGLLAFLQFAGNPEASTAAALLELQASEVTKLTVSDADGNEVGLALQGDQWVLA